MDINIEQREEDWKRRIVTQTVTYIQKNYPEKPADTVCRILFLGTSQTAGEGASERARTFVKLLEDKLNLADSTDTYFQCINAGIPGVNSSYIIELYEKEWLNLDPKVVVINLRTNDKSLGWSRNAEESP